MGKDLQAGALSFLRPLLWELLATPPANAVRYRPFCQRARVTAWKRLKSCRSSEMNLPLCTPHLPDTHCAIFFTCKGRIWALGIYSWITYTMFTWGFLGSLLRSVLNWLHEIGIHRNELFWAKQDTATCRGLRSERGAEKQQSGTSGDTTRRAKEKH